MRNLILILLALFFSTTSLADTSTSYKIGLITDLSGVGAFWGTDTKRGAELAIEESKKNGINVSLIIGDHRFKTADALSEAEKMTRQDKVDALYVEFSPTSIAAAGTSTKSKTLMLTTCAATSHLKNNPFVFKGFLDWYSGCRAIAKYWKSQGITKLGLLKANVEFGELCMNAAQEVFPEATVQTYGIGEEVNMQVLALKNAGVQAILNGALEGDTINMFKAMNRLQFTVPTGGDLEDTVTQVTMAEHADSLSRSLLFGLKSVESKFDKRFSDLGLRIPTHKTAAAMAYVHTLQLISAFTKCPKKDVECQAKTLNSSPSESLLGFKRWENRQAIYENGIYEWSRNGLLLIQPY